jgi:hypothetical protein
MPCDYSGGDAYGRFRFENLDPETKDRVLAKQRAQQILRYLSSPHSYKVAIVIVIPIVDIVHVCVR